MTEDFFLTFLSEILGFPGVIKVFLAVNDVVCLEFKDPNPLDTSKYGFVGF